MERIEGSSGRKMPIFWAKQTSCLSNLDSISKFFTIFEFGVGFRRQFDDKLSLSSGLTAGNEFLEYAFWFFVGFSEKLGFENREKQI